MTRNIFALAFLLGAAVVAWVGIGFIGSNPLALVMTLIIAAVYSFGALELIEFRRATLALESALAQIPDPLSSLAEWLDRLPAALRNPVRLRIEGERGGLPGPALTTYLVGLLVMLGMLGTFLGMVVTLNGSVFALEGSADLLAIRSALAAPIRGLGLAFGTSIAGVAASAMLGLISALCRRERLLTAQLLDTRIATVLRRFSLSHQRQETLTALQFQAQALPAVVDKLQLLMDQLERRDAQSAERLASQQQRFHSEVRDVYTDLASAVEASLKDSLAQGARVAGETLKPAVEAAMAGIAREAQAMHEKMIDSTQARLDGLSARFAATADSVAQTWRAALDRQDTTNAQLSCAMNDSLSAFNASFARQSSSLLVAVDERWSTALAGYEAGDRQRLEAWTQTLASIAEALRREWQEAGAHVLSGQQQICTTLEQSARRLTENAQVEAGRTLDETTRLLACAEDLLASRLAGEALWSEQQGQRMDQLAALWRSELGALRAQEDARGNAAVDRLGELQTALAGHLTTLGAALEAPMARLIETASEAPRAAAEVIGQLRQEIANSSARDNQLLDERSRILATLNSLLAAIDQSSAAQRATIDSLVSSSALLLDQAGSRLAEQVGSESARLAELAGQVTGSAVEVSSLSEAFGFAVELFSAANEKLIASLQKIEVAMDQSTARSDDQLAYYVAQAREIIDLSIMSQKGVVDELRQITSPSAPLAEAVR